MQTPPFLNKLYQLVEDAKTADLVGWTDDNGRSFTVHKTNEFARDVLPKYFKHSNFSSFVRQLNQYGFHKQNPDKWMFGHDSFRKDRPDLLKSITRRRPKQTVIPPVTQAVVAPHTLGQNRGVLELGQYGIDGELKALRRDKDLLIKELVVTRQAEEKLKSKCDSLESRMQSLEHTTKQMQSFIMHYFSQVLQPYSQAVASRKRKRLPSSQPDGTNNGATNLNGDTGMDTGMDVLASDDTAGNEMTKMAQMAQAAAAAAATGTSTVDALRVMMQQMGMNAARNPASAHAKPRALDSLPTTEDRPRITFDPATVQELPVTAEEVGANGTLESNAVVNTEAPPTPNMGNTVMGGDGDITHDVSLDFLEDISLSPQTSLSMDAIEHAMKDSPRIPSANGLAHDMQLDGRAFGHTQHAQSDGFRDDVQMGSREDEERAIEDLLELDDASLPAPLTHLPEGTDIHSLTQSIESFTNQ